MPGIRATVAGAFAGRASVGMTPLGTVLLVHGHTGSYAAAGACTATFALATAVAAPLRGRLIDRRGHWLVLNACAIGYSGALATMVITSDSHAPVVVTAVASGIAGLAFPPLSAAMLAVWASVVETPDLLQVAYAFDASCAEAGFLIGSLLVAGIAAAVSPDAAIIVAAAIGLAGTLLFTRSRASRSWRPAPLTAPPRWSLAVAGVRTILIQATGIGIALGAIEVGVPAFAQAQGSAAGAGLLLATYSVGSLIGGIWLAASASLADHHLVRRYTRLLALAMIVSVPLPIVDGTSTMLVALVVNGFFLAPVVAVMYLLLEGLAPPETVTEAFTWVTTATFGGAAAGSAVAGVLTQRFGASVALVTVVAFSAATWASAQAMRGTLAPAGA